MKRNTEQSTSKVNVSGTKRAKNAPFDCRMSVPTTEPVDALKNLTTVLEQGYQEYCLKTVGSKLSIDEWTEQLGEYCGQKQKYITQTPLVITSPKTKTIQHDQFEDNLLRYTQIYVKALYGYFEHVMEPKKAAKIIGHTGPFAVGFLRGYKAETAKNNPHAIKDALIHESIETTYDVLSSRYIPLKVVQEISRLAKESYEDMSKSDAFNITKLDLSTERDEERLMMLGSVKAMASLARATDYVKNCLKKIVVNALNKLPRDLDHSENALRQSALPFLAKVSEKLPELNKQKLISIEHIPLEQLGFNEHIVTLKIPKHTLPMYQAFVREQLRLHFSVEAGQIKPILNAGEYCTPISYIPENVHEALDKLNEQHLQFSLEEYNAAIHQAASSELSEKLDRNHRILEEIRSLQNLQEQRRTAADFIQHEKNEIQLILDNTKAGIDGMALGLQIAGKHKLAYHLSYCGHHIVNIVQCVSDIKNASQFAGPIAAGFALGPWVGVAVSAYSIFSFLKSNGNSNEVLQRSLRTISKQINGIHKHIASLQKQLQFNYEQTMKMFKSSYELMKRNFTIIETKQDLAQLELEGLANDISLLRNQLNYLQKLHEFSMRYLSMRMDQNQGKLLDYLQTAKIEEIDRRFAFIRTQIHAYPICEDRDFQRYFIELHTIVIEDCRSKSITECENRLPHLNNDDNSLALQVTSTLGHLQKQAADIDPTFNFRRRLVNPEKWICAVMLIQQLIVHYTEINPAKKFSPGEIECIEQIIQEGKNVELFMQTVGDAKFIARLFKNYAHCLVEFKKAFNKQLQLFEQKQTNEIKSGKQLELNRRKITAQGNLNLVRKSTHHTKKHKDCDYPHKNKVAGKIYKQETKNLAKIKREERKVKHYHFSPFKQRKMRAERQTLNHELMALTNTPGNRLHLLAEEMSKQYHLLKAYLLFAYQYSGARDDLNQFFNQINLLRDQAAILNYLQSYNGNRAYLNEILEESIADVEKFAKLLCRRIMEKIIIPEYPTVSQAIRSLTELVRVLHISQTERTQVTIDPSESILLSYPKKQLLELDDGREHVQQTLSLDIPGLIYQNIPGDGHCLYHAVGLYLNRSQTSLRKDVAHYIERNFSEFREFLETRIGQSAENYVQGIRKGKEWAGNVEIEVLMRVFKRPIIVIGLDGYIQNQEALQRFNGEPIFVLYNGYNHYDGFLRQAGIASQEILIHLTEQNEHVANSDLSANDKLPNPKKRLLELEDEESDPAKASCVSDNQESTAGQNDFQSYSNASDNSEAQANIESTDCAEPNPAQLVTRFSGIFHQPNPLESQSQESSNKFVSWCSVM